MSTIKIDLDETARGCNDAVTAICAEKEFWLSDSKLPRSLYRGTKGMKLAGTDFLPKHALESDAAYAIRIDQSVLLNAYMKTIVFLAGQVFQSDLSFADSVASDFINDMKNCDSKGNDVNTFCKRVFINGLAKGVSHVLVDAPVSDSSRIRSVAEERQLGIRPMLKEIAPERIIGWRVDNNGVLENVRILETYIIPMGEFGSEVKERIRVLYADGFWELYNVDSTNSATKVDGGSFSYPGIPLVTFIPGREYSEMTGETPLVDLADLNAAHWRSSSDQINILHVGRVPILFGRYIELSQMPVGVSAMISSEDDNSDLKYVEITGKAIEAGNTDVKELEAKMALYGLQQLIPRSGNMTATEKALTSRESNSSLGTWAIEFENFLQALFEIYMEMGSGEFPDSGVDVNKEYNFGVISPEDATTLLKMNEQGVLSAESTFEEFRRRGMLTEELTWEDDEERKEADRQNKEEETKVLSGLLGSTGAEGDTGSAGATK